MATLTVRLQDLGLTQSELQDQLGRLVGKDAHIAPAFPGDEHSRYKRTFVVTVPGGGGTSMAESLKKMPEVELAYLAPSRG
jgi:hypothetical protein